MKRYAAGIQIRLWLSNPKVELLHIALYSVLHTNFSEFTFGHSDLYSLPEPEDEDNFDEEDNGSRPNDPQGPEAAELPLAAVKHQVDVLLEEWNKGADMLFSIHPMDGSLLVWHVDWLDEYQPGMFRQAQVHSMFIWFM